MARWARKVSPEEREKTEAMFAEARRKATTEFRDGREFTVLRFPDRYGVNERDEEDERALDRLDVED